MISLDELRRLTQAALLGPWEYHRAHEGWDVRSVCGDGVTRDAGMRAQEAALIVAMRNALPELLDRIEQLEWWAIRAQVLAGDPPYHDCKGPTCKLCALGQSDD